MVGEGESALVRCLAASGAHIGVIAMASCCRALASSDTALRCTPIICARISCIRGRQALAADPVVDMQKASAPNAAAVRQVDMRQRRAFLNKDSFPYQPAELETRTQHPEVHWIAKAAKVVLEFQYTSRGRQRIALGQK